MQEQGLGALLVFSSSSEPHKGLPPFLPKLSLEAKRSVLLLGDWCILDVTVTGGTSASPISHDIWISASRLKLKRTFSRNIV
jgi:hypothetical protein